MILILSSRYVTTADQCLPPIRATTSHRRSPVVRAGTSMRMGAWDANDRPGTDTARLESGQTRGSGAQGGSTFASWNWIQAGARHRGDKRHGPRLLVEGALHP